MGYQPVIPNYQQQQQNIPQAQNNAQNGIVWVQGIEGAKAYPVGANNSMLLMDSEENVFYIKSTDASGMPMPLRAFTYSEIGNQKTEHVDMSGYVTRDEFEQQIAELQKKIKPNNKKKEKEDAE